MASRRRYTKRHDSLGRPYVIDTSTGKRAPKGAYERESKRRAKVSKPSVQKKRSTAAERLRKLQAEQRAIAENIRRLRAEQRALERKSKARPASKRVKPKKAPKAFRGIEPKFKVVPLTPKERRQRAKQRRLAEQEQERLYNILEREAIQKVEREAVEQLVPKGLVAEGFELVQPAFPVPEYKVTKREARRALAQHLDQSDKDAYDRFKQYKRALYERLITQLQARGVPSEIFRETLAFEAAKVLYQMALEAGYDGVTAARFARLS